MAGNRTWRKASTAWSTLSRRERVLIFLTVTALPVILLFVMVMEPALKRLQGIDGQIESLQASVASQENILKLYRDTPLIDPNIKAREELSDLVNRLERYKGDLERFSRKLVGPQEMLALLHQMLGAEQGLKIIDATSLPREPLILNQETQAEALGMERGQQPAEAARESAMKQAVIYIHPFELQLEGSYSALYRYLQRMEEMHQGFFWDKLEFTAEAYPNARIRLRIHTLSTEESWLGA